MRRDLPLPVDNRAGPAALGRLGVEAVHAEHVIDVVVREHRRGQRRVGPPAAHALEERLRVLLRARVEHHQTVARVQRVGAGDRLVIEQPLGDLVRAPLVPHPADRVRLADRVDLAVPESVAEVADVRHLELPYLLTR